MHNTLIEGCKEGDKVAQKKLYDLYIHAMYNTCWRMVRNKEDTEEIVQDAFVKAFRNIDSFKYKSTFGAWLKRIVINQSINFLNKQKIEFCPLQPKEYRLSESPDIMKSPPNVEHILQGINRLPDGYARILSLYLIEGYDHVEISEITGISVATSKSQFHRAKKRLREILVQL